MKEKFPDAPFIPRPAQINAWDNEDFVKAVEATGKKQLIIAGIVTDVCVLIISDAGAARGNFDQERVDNTKAWIEQLQQSVRYYAWLNPMPSECWRQTTAGEIARCRCLK
ncbi:isochorismatase family protein [Nostoc sp. CHAB 5834]|nr:isochorismatase family protein [Nostoc sp. CHAB 5834]